MYLNKFDIYLENKNETFLCNDAILFVPEYVIPDRNAPQYLSMRDSEFSPMSR